MEKSKLELAKEKSLQIKNRMKMKDDQLKEDGETINQMINIEKTLDEENIVETTKTTETPINPVATTSDPIITENEKETSKSKKKKADKIPMPYDNENKFLIFDKGTAGYYMYKAYDERLQQIADNYNDELKKLNSKSKVTKGMVLENILEEYFKNLDNK